MGHRTAQMEYEKWRDTSPELQHATIAGRKWDCNDGCCTRSIRPDAKRPPECHVTTPHPDPDKRARGWRLGWIFLVVMLIIFTCILIGYVPTDMLVCAAGVC